MKIITHECPNCGAHLDIKNNHAKGKCPYCRVSYTFNNGVVKTNITNPEVNLAETYLYKFKDYDKSEQLFKKLLINYLEEPRMHIGLILSITHDFTFNTSSFFDITTIVESWKKYVALSSEEDVSKYEKQFNKYVANYWLTKLTSETDNFTDYTTEQSLSVLLSYLSSYSLYVSEAEYKKVLSQFEIYKIKRTSYERRIKVIKFLIFAAIVSVICYCFFTYNNKLKNDKPQVIKDTVNISDIINYPYCDANYFCSNYKFLLDNFKDSFSDLFIEEAKIDRENSKISFSVKLVNSKISKTFEYEFDIIDDVGPYIVDKKCTFTDTDTVDLSNCYSIDSFNNNITIDKSDVKVDDTNVNFNELGEKNILVSFYYKGKTISNHINVYIIKSDIEFTFNLDSTGLEKNKSVKFNYSFDKDISNKEIKYDYDSSFIKMNTSSNTIVGIKEGNTTFCAYPVYDESQIQCFDLSIMPVCKGTYTFNFDGLSKNKIVAGVDICPGIYKIYTNVVNNDKSYLLTIRDEKGFHSETVYIYKKSEYSNDEGGNFSFGNNFYLDIPVGVTSVKLVK